VNKIAIQGIIVNRHDWPERICPPAVQQIAPQNHFSIIYLLNSGRFVRNPHAASITLIN